MAQINWNGIGYFYYFPKESQARVFKKLGKEGYIKLPKQGTNPRGVEITKNALEILTKDKMTKHIKIEWKRTKIHYDIYDRWIILWKNNIHAKKQSQENKKLFGA